ncbi:MAG: S41 family peptidase, partial [Bacteroidota bacterium]
MAILRIRSMSYGGTALQLKFQRALKSAFRQIENAGVNRLVLDLRNNLGGASINIGRVLRYLLDEQFLLLNNMQLKRSALRYMSFREKIYLPLALRKMSDTHHRLITYRKRFKPANKHQYDGEL